MTVAGMISDSRNTVNELAMDAQPRYRDSNRELCFWITTRKTTLVPSHSSLTGIRAVEVSPGKKQHYDPVWAIFGQYSPRDEAPIVGTF